MSSVLDAIFPPGMRSQVWRLLELPELLAVIGEFDAKGLVYPWKHPDPEMDALASCLFQTVSRRQDQNKSRAEIFGEIWELVRRTPAPVFPHQLPAPHLDEPWYCCAEPAPQV